MLISVIVPVGDGREANLANTLKALGNQLYRNFEVIVSHDGDSALVYDVVKKFPDQDRAFYIRNQSLAPNLGAVNRNHGAKFAHGDFLVFVDSDVLLPPHALETYAEDFTNFPYRAIAGPYHWLPPMEDVETKIDNWEAFVSEAREAIAREATHGYHGHNVGFDTRDVFEQEQGDILHNGYPRCLNLLSGNLAIHRALWQDAGGFWEKLSNGIDGAFSMALVQKGRVFSFDKRTEGWHQYHDRASWLNTEEVARSRKLIMDRFHSDQSWLGQMKHFGV